jgi:adenylate cyclase
MGQVTASLAAPAAQPAASLPERWKQGRRRAALACLLAVALLAVALLPQSKADQLDSWWLRVRFSLREALQKPQSEPLIGLVEIDDKSLAAWRATPDPAHPGSVDPRQELTLAWGGHIATALRQLQRSGARLVGLDWTQPVETDAWCHWDNDARLGRAISGGVVFAKFVEPGGGYVLPTPSLAYSLPDAYQDGGSAWMGTAELVTADSVQSSVVPVIGKGKSAELSFAARIAQKISPHALQGLPLRSDGSLLLNFANGSGLSGDRSAFVRASLVDVERATRPDPRWKGRVVLIGSNYKGNDDAHFIPFTNTAGSLLERWAGVRLAPGLEVQANAVATLLHHNAIEEPGAAATLVLALLAGALGVGLYALFDWARATLAALALVVLWAAGSFALFIAAHFALPLTVPLLTLLLGAGLMGGYRALSEERERAQVMSVWGRHQDPRLISELLAHPEWRGGEGRELVVTVLFADLKNFTKTVEPLTPPQALEALNRYLALLSTAILENGGIVDKYLGDGLMAQWGAPAPRADHADAAVAACLDIEARLRALTPHLQAAGQVTFETRLTLHSGPVVAGPLGSDERLEYTLIGDTVNVTSRLQETAKQMDCDFLMSQTTREFLTVPVATGRQAQVEIRGRQQPLRVFEVLKDQSAATAPPSPPL